MTRETDLVIIGGGPAGCAAAVMAASVGLTSTIIEPRERLGGALWRIAATENVLGGHRTGPSLARAVLADVERAAPHVVQGTATRVEAGDDSVSVTLANGDCVTGQHVVVATGVEPVQPQDSSWITAAAPMSLPPLWDADPTDAAGQTWLVLGADRPLGTFLRANPELAITLLVPHPLSDAYKADEVAGDLRSPCGQRVQTAMGSGAEAALTAYYALRI